MKVWVTRDETGDGPLSTALRAVGFEVVLEPVLAKQVLTDAAAEISALGADDWLVLTSPFAVQTVALEPARVPRVAVVGKPSQQLAEAGGLRVQMVSPGGTAKSLFAELRRRVRDGKVCYPRSTLVDAPAAWDNVELISPILYDTVTRVFDRTVVHRIDVVTVASPSAVRAIGRLDKPFASIGPTTSRALEEIGVRPWLEAPVPTFDSLALSIAAHADDWRHHRA